MAQRSIPGYLDRWKFTEPIFFHPEPTPKPRPATGDRGNRRVATCPPILPRFLSTVRDEGLIFRHMHRCHPNSPSLWSYAVQLPPPRPFIYLTCYNAVLMAFDRNHIEDSAWREAIHQLFRFPLEPVTQNNYVLPSAFTPWLSSWIDRVYGYVWKLENGDRTGMRACFCTHQSQHAYSYLPNFDILADYSLLSKALSQNAHRGV